MFQLQCLKEMRRQIQGGEVNEAQIGRILKVNRSTVSRCIKKCREQKILEEEGYVLTKKGEEMLTYYEVIEADLYQYFASIGVEEEAQYQAVAGMMDSVDIHTIRKICQKEKRHLHYDQIGENEGKEVRKISYQELGVCLTEKEFPVDFTIYRQGDGHTISMADEGFEKPAMLSYDEENGALILTIREVQAMTRGGAILSGYVQSVKCRSKQDVLKTCPSDGKTIRIPLQEFWFEQLSETQFMGQVQLIMTSSVGEKRMPESMATLVLRF